MTDTAEVQIAYGCCWTLAFVNTNLGQDVFVWVCRDRAEYDKRFVQLEALAHIIVLQSGPSCVK